MNESFEKLKKTSSVSFCLQCHKCASGCPISEAQDFRPDQIIRLMQMDQKDELLNSRTIWLCTSCHTCSSRCPAGVDPCKVQDGLRRIFILEGKNNPIDNRSVAAANSFLLSVEKYGRLNELDTARRFKIKTGTYFELFWLGITMFFKGKLKLFVKKISRRKEVSATIRRHMLRRTTKE